MFTHKENQLKSLWSELELTQRQVDKYDQMSTTIKTWAITLWAASVGWTLQSHRRETALLGLVIIIIFWGFDSINKNFRQDYGYRRNEIGLILAHFFKTESFPEGTVSPNLPHHDIRNVRKHIFKIHLILPYMILGLISLGIYLEPVFSF